MSRSVAAGLALLALAACVTPAPNAPVSHEIVQTGGEETLLDVARAHDLGYLELVAANPGVDPWLPGDATRIVLPTVHLSPPAPQEGIVVNLAEQRLYWFGSDGERLTFPIGIGRPGWRTPIGTTTVVRKRESPTWYPPASARREDPTLPTVVPPGPDNPLGTHAVYLGWPRFLLHGTNEPDGVGRRVSRGCVRLYPEDIVRLYERVELGTPVRVVNEPVKLGHLEGELFLEVHPPLSQEAALPDVASIGLGPELEARVRAEAGTAVERVDWETVERALREQQGVPVQITRVATPPPHWLRALADRVLRLTRDAFGDSGA